MHYGMLNIVECEQNKLLHNITLSNCTHNCKQSIRSRQTVNPTLGCLFFFFTYKKMQFVTTTHYEVLHPDTSNAK